MTLPQHSWSDFLEPASGQPVSTGGFGIPAQHDIYHVREFWVFPTVLIGANDVIQGDLVVLTASSGHAWEVTKTTTQGQQGTIGVALEPATHGAGVQKRAQFGGKVGINCSAAVTAGQWLRPSATQGQAEPCLVTDAGAFARALTDSSTGAGGLVTAMIYPDIAVGVIQALNGRSANVASAATITLPDSTNRTYPITGTTTVSSITAQSAGRLIVLEFQSTGCTVQNGSNLKLAATFISKALQTLTLESDGTNWVEVARGGVGAPLSVISPTVANPGLAVGTGTLAALATGATDGFFYISSSAGPPTGVPSTATGHPPIHWDSLYKRLYIYDYGAAAWYYVGMSQNGVTTAAVVARNDGTTNLTQSAETTIPLPATTFDKVSGQSSAGQHYISTANLTGTVSKTNGSNVLTGVNGTSLFTTELGVGQVIDVPGGSTERKVVTAITDTWHATVNSNFSNTASGQTAVRTNEELVCLAPGVYFIFATASWNANSTGDRYGRIYVNGSTGVRLFTVKPSGLNTFAQLSVILTLAQWDRVLLKEWTDQASQTTFSDGHTPELGWMRICD